MSALLLFAAFAIALTRSLRIRRAALRGWNRSKLIASSMCLPRTMLATIRTLRDDSRTNRNFAVASISISCLLLRSWRRRRWCGRRRRGRHGRARRGSWTRSPWCSRGARRSGDGLALARVAMEHARWRELAQLVADHVLGHEHRNELLAVVHGERQPDHFGQHRRAARPGLDDLLGLLLLRLEHLVEQVLVDEWTFLDRASHG